MEELKEIKKELEEILERVNTKLDGDDKKYWLIHNGEIMQYTDDGHRLDIFNKEIGNFFKTEKEAEKYLEDLKVKTEIKNIAKELNKGKEINWRDCFQDKYFLIYSHVDSEVSNARYNNNYPWKSEGTIHCLDSDFADECIKRIGKERLENYLKRN